MAEQLRPREEDGEIEIDPLALEKTNQDAETRLANERADATEVQKDVAAAQARSLETSSLVLMKRTAEGGKNNVELINAVQELLQGLEVYSSFKNQKPIMGNERQEELTNFLKEVGKALRHSVATKGHIKDATAEKVDFSRWESKKK